MKHVLFTGLLVVPTFGLMGVCFQQGRIYQGKIDKTTIDAIDRTVHAEQLTVNDIPVISDDELPGIAGTKEHPDTCVNYYDTARQAIYSRYLHPNVLPNEVKK